MNFMSKLLLVAFVWILVLEGLGQTMIKQQSAEAYYDINGELNDSLVVSASNEKRIALVIGNRAYKTSPLQNAENDAADLAELLVGKNFEVVKVIDGTRMEMRDAVRAFTSKIAKGGIGLFYYAGHGVQANNDNYLVPIDADFEYENEVADMCISVSRILNAMEISNNRLNIMILDACRNSPFNTFSRSAEKGMLSVEAPTGSIVAYSTAPGKTASDGTGRNGVYTSKLMKYMNVPGLSLEAIFKQVRIDVIKETSNRQIPWESNALVGDFYFTVD